MICARPTERNVLHKMETHRVKRLPVIENHRLVGMITEADLAYKLNTCRLAEFVEKVYLAD
jgi:CBS domain-containing protein